MITSTEAVSTDGRASGLLSVVLVALFGVGIVTVAGLSQAHALHAAAHDARHAVGFPCH